MLDATQILSNITVYNKYAKYLPHLNRRETWGEICSRYAEMLSTRYPHMKVEIDKKMLLVHDKKVLPSMRALQFAGPAIQKNNARIYNCAFLPVNDYHAFSETMFLLLGGTGVGYSVQRHHVAMLPKILKPVDDMKFLIGDSIEGWADAVKALMKSYFGMLPYRPQFEYSDIRPKGAELITAGGKAPGPEPLKICLNAMESIMSSKKDGERLSPIDVHDLLCHIANAVLAGGIRRAAMISLFSPDDEQMMTCKSGNWWESNEQRGRANNSAMLLRSFITEKEFKTLWKTIELSNSGEPGVYFTDNLEWGSNPCCLASDSLLLTAKGYKSIGELAGKEGLKLVNKNGDIVDGVVWATGVKKVLKISAGNTKRPHVLRATADHRFMLQDGLECTADVLKGKRLMPYYQMKRDFDIGEARFGFLLGDGSFRKDSISFKNVNCCFTPGKDDEVKYLFNKTGWSKNETVFTVDVSFEELQKRGIDTSCKTFERSLPEVLTPDFLMGLYSANGSVLANSRVTLKTSSPKLRDEVMAFMKDLGIEGAYYTTNKAGKVEFTNGTYECKESYDVNIGQLNDLILFAEKVGFIQSYKTEALEKAILAKAPYVYAVEETGQETVYDFSLFDDTHWGVVNGIVTHNCEIALKPFQFCNLTEINVSDIKNDKDFFERVEAASFFGTLQAGVTDFHYLRPIWKQTTEEEALVGVGMTGIGSGEILKYDLEKAATFAKTINERVADLIGIQHAARVTTIKPSGTSSLVLGTSSGIHAWHNDYYVRRMRVGKNEAIYTYLSINHPELVEDESFRPEIQAIITIPQKAPEGAILRTESVFDLLNRVKRFNVEWVKKGHRKGDNTNNVSATISIKPDEWKEVGEWMWKNKNTYNGLSVLPYDNGSYIQAPFEDITKERYYELIGSLSNVDLTKIVEFFDDTTHSQEPACAGAACDIIV